MKTTIKYSAILILISIYGCTNSKKSEEIKQISKEINQKITSIEISAIELKSNTIPDSIFKFNNLRELSIQGNDCDVIGIECYMIREISKEIGNLKKLEELSFPVNGISELPKEMKNLQNLKLLSLIDNPGLHDIEVITELKNLETLYLFGCQLEKLPKEIGKMKNLKAIYLTGNNFSKEEQKRIGEELPKGCEIHFDADYQVIVN